MKKLLQQTSLLLALVLLLPINGWAMPQTDAEFALLPPYCRARIIEKNGPNYTYWSKKLGGGFIHVHHSCEAYDYMNKARMVFGQERMKLFKFAVGGFDY